MFRDVSSVDMVERNLKLAVRNNLPLIRQGSKFSPFPMRGILRLWCIKKARSCHFIIGQEVHYFFICF